MSAALLRAVGRAARLAGWQPTCQTRLQGLQAAWHKFQAAVPRAFTWTRFCLTTADGPADDNGPGPAQDPPSRLQPPTPTMPSQLLHNIKLVLPATNDDAEPIELNITRTTAELAIDALETYGFKFVKDPHSGGLVSTRCLMFHDNMTITAALPEKERTEKRVEVVEGFVRSVVKGAEQEARETVYNLFCKLYGKQNVDSLDVSKVTSESGKTREVDGVVMASTNDKLVFGIVEAKTKVNVEKDIQQVESLLEFVRTERLKGNVGTMMRKGELRGFLAYKVTPSDRHVLDQLRGMCRARNIGVLVTSGEGMALGNSVLSNVAVDMP